MAYAKVQGTGVQRSGNSNSPILLAYPSPTTTGNLLTCRITLFGSAVSTITDSKSNTWHLAVAKVSGSQHAEIWYCQNATGGISHQVTITPASFAFVSVSIEEYSGGAKSGGPDQTNSNSGTSSTPSSSSVITAADGELYLAVLDEDAVVSSITTENGWTNDYTHVGTPTQEGISSETLGDTSSVAAGTYTATWSMAVSTSWVAVIATFKLGSGGSGSGHKLKTLPQSTIVCSPNPPAGGYTFTPQSLPSASGYIGPKVDLGSAPRSSKYWWHAITTTNNPATINSANYVDLYVANMSDFDFGITDGYLPGSGTTPPAGNVVIDASFQYPENLTFMGRLTVDNVLGSGDLLISSGLVELFDRYIYPVWFNNTGVPLSAASGQHQFTLTPSLDQVQ